MNAYAGEVQKLECHFNSLKLKHVPHGQDVVVKELSWIVTKGLPVTQELLLRSCPSHPLLLKMKSLEPHQHPVRGLHQLQSNMRARMTRQSNGASCSLQLVGLAKK
jgi:hypothetical protein